MLGQRWLSLLFLVLVAVVWPARASAWTTANAQTRVGVIEVAVHAIVGAESARSPGTRRAKSSAGYEVASDSALAAEGVAAAATQAPKLLNAVPKSVLNTANHIFGPKSLAEHQLGPLLEAFGGDAVGATYRLQNAAQALANQGAIRGVFQTTVDVAGQAVTVRGAVIDGVVNLRTAFIP